MYFKYFNKYSISTFSEDSIVASVLVLAIARTQDHQNPAAGIIGVAASAGSSSTCTNHIHPSSPTALPLHSLFPRSSSLSSFLSLSLPLSLYHSIAVCSVGQLQWSHTLIAVSPLHVNSPVAALQRNC